MPDPLPVSPPGAHRLPASSLESQHLLTPALVPVKPSQLDKLPTLTPMLRRIGIELVPMGPETLGIQTFPSFLFDRGVEPAEFLAELLEKSDEEGFAPSSESALHEVLDMMACKAAIKAGDRMTDPELQELIKLREGVERSSSCPHGRPTSVRLTIRELEKLFHRA